MYLCQELIFFMRRLRLILLLVSGLIIFSAQAQGDLKVFKGLLLDSETGLPIRDAHIYSSSKFGTITDTEGAFTIYSTLHDTILVSCLGYKKSMILPALFPNYENAIATFMITPATYTLLPVEIPSSNSIVVMPEEIRQPVAVEGVTKGKKNEIWGFDLGEGADLKLKKGATPEWERPYPSVGITISGFLSSWLGQKTKEEKKLEEIKNDVGSTSFFDSYMASPRLKDILLAHGMNEAECKKFIEGFIDNAGKVKYATTEYEILTTIFAEIEEE